MLLSALTIARARTYTTKPTAFFSPSTQLINRLFSTVTSDSSLTTSESPQHLSSDTTNITNSVDIDNIIQNFSRRDRTIFNNYRKLKPSIIQRRLRDLKTYIGSEKNIRHSPWRLNLVCQFAARHGDTVPETLTQLMFCQKSKAPLVHKVVKRTSNLADIRDGLQPSQLEVAECFATHGTHLKRLAIMSRGRAGTKRRRHSHIRLVIREIDFDLKIATAPTLKKKKRWLVLKEKARLDYETRKKERDEIFELERQVKEAEEKRKKKGN